MAKTTRAPATWKGNGASPPLRQRRGWQGLQLPACCFQPASSSPYLAGRRQGCCSRQRGMPGGGRGLSAGSPAADEALGALPEHPMLCHPDWKRTRQGRGFSGAVNPALPREWCWKAGGSGEGRSLLEGPGAASLGLSAGRAMPGWWQGPGRWRRWWGKGAVGAGEGTAAPGVPLAFSR